MKDRMRGTKEIGWVLAMSILLGAASFAAADGPGERGPRKGGDRMARLDRMADRLDLTAEQREGISAIEEKGRTEGVEDHKTLRRLENRLEGLMLEDSPNAKEVTKLVEQMGEIRTRMEARRMTRRLAIRELLTPEQRDRMVLGGREGRRGGRHGEGHGGPRGRHDRPRERMRADVRCLRGCPPGCEHPTTGD